MLFHDVPRLKGMYWNRQAGDLAQGSGPEGASQAEWRVGPERLINSATEVHDKVAEVRAQINAA